MRGPFALPSKPHLLLLFPTLSAPAIASLLLFKHSPASYCLRAFALFPAWSICSLRSPLGLWLISCVFCTTFSKGESCFGIPYQNVQHTFGSVFPLSLSPTFFLSMVLITHQKTLSFCYTLLVFCLCPRTLEWNLWEGRQQF